MKNSQIFYICLIFVLLTVLRFNEDFYAVYAQDEVIKQSVTIGEYGSLELGKELQDTIRKKLYMDIQSNCRGVLPYYCYKGYIGDEPFILETDIHNELIAYSYTGSLDKYRQDDKYSLGKAVVTESTTVKELNKKGVNLFLIEAYNKKGESYEMYYTHKEGQDYYLRFEGSVLKALSTTR